MLLPTLGSAGDVHPFIGLGLALQARGHRATLLTNPVFQPLIERAGLGFEPIGSLEQARAAVNNPAIWHPRKGLRLVLRIMAPAIVELFRVLERRADSRTVVAASSLALGARVAQDKLGIPTATVHLQPSVLRSLEGEVVIGKTCLSAAQPRWMKAACYRLIDWLLIDRELRPTLNALRATLGMRPIDRVLHRWVHSPRCVLALFPSWFAAPQRDWPEHTQQTGFLLWDGRQLMDSTLTPRLGAIASMEQVEPFLGDGAAPIVVTAGSAAATVRDFFAATLRALKWLDARAVLVTNFPEQLPAQLPPSVRAFGYLPFTKLLPRAALIIHHGGIGTVAQAIAAGIPQLLVPRAFDQFDNARHVEQLGLGASVPQARYRAARAARLIGSMLEDRALRQRCRDCAPRIDSTAALTAACRSLEDLAQPPSIALALA